MGSSEEENVGKEGEKGKIMEELEEGKVCAIKENGLSWERERNRREKEKETI